MGTAIVPQKEEEKIQQAAPFLVEAEKLFEEFAETTRRIAGRAYEFFEKRGGEFGRDFEDWFKAESELLRRIPVEMTEDEQKLNIRANVAGFKPEEIEISVLPTELIMRGKTTAESDKKDDEKTILHEWRSNQFFRKFTLPTAVDSERVEATLKDGVLQLMLPKLPIKEAANISIKAE